jgi:hypothetical protein
MWHDTQYNRDLQSDLMHSYETRVYHDRPWYWVVLLNNAKKHIPGGRSTPRDLGKSYINGAANNQNTEPTQKKSLKDPLEPKIDAQLKDEIDALIRDAQIDAEIDAEIEAEIEKMEAQFDEVEALMDENDEHLVYVDGRYIQVIEEENMWLRNEVLQLRQTVINLDHMYQAESAKVRAFSLPIEENL